MVYALYPHYSLWIYANLMKDKEHLQNQLEDFELLAGDAAKKNR